MAARGKYVGRGGLKLEFALRQIGLSVAGLTAADFGCSVGGFTDCLLKHGAARVYAVDTGYGVLDWSLRCDDRVVVLERTNAMHVRLPEAVDLVAVDVGWTRQSHILPNAVRQAKKGGMVLSLFKPQYEAAKQDLRAGRLVDGRFDAVLAEVTAELSLMGIAVAATIRLPHGPRRKNPEAFLRVPVLGAPRPPS